MARVASDEPVLSEVQSRVVFAPRGRLVFLGGPGAGKSLVLGERAVRLIESGAADPAAVLLLAPSRRAATALGRYVQDRLAGGPAPTATSFHGLALTILRQHYRDMGYPRPPALLTTSRQFHTLRTMLAEEGPALWPHHGRSGGSAFHRLAYDVVMGGAENGIDAAELGQRAEAWGRPELRDFAGFAARYAAQLRQAGQIDFGQLLAGTVALLSENRRVAASYHRAYRHILVDEFEQANFVQAELLRLLLDEDTDLLVAGDPAQGINGYRSGTPALLLACPRRLDARVIASAENHRSRGRIAGLGAALHPASADHGEVGAWEEWTPTGDRREMDGGKDEAGYVVLRPFAYPAQEARWVAAGIESLLRADVSPARVAVLFRSLDLPLAKLIAGALARRQIPHLVQAGRKVTGDPLVQGTFSLLRYLLSSGPNASTVATGEATAGAQASGDGGAIRGGADAFLQLLDSPLAGLPAFGRRELRRAAIMAGRELGGLEAEGLDGLAIGDELRAKVAALLDDLRFLRPRSLRSAAGLLWEIWRRFPAFRDDALSGGGSSAALSLLLSEVAGIEEERGPLGLGELVALWDAGRFDQIAAQTPQTHGVVLTTIHQAKGQEWDFVFVPGLVEGSFPLARSPLDVGPLLARDLASASSSSQADAAAQLAVLGRSGHLAEERRVFYVAVSRPRLGLYLSYSRRTPDGGSAELPSRFLNKVAECPGVELVSGDGPEEPPSDAAGAVIHCRRRLRGAEPLSRAKALYALHTMRERWPDVVRPEEWWANVAETSGAAPPFPEGRLYLSASRLGAYRDCPLAYQFGNHWRLGEPEGAALTMGSILHAVLEDYHRPGTPLPRAREVLEESLDRRFDPRAFRYRPIAKQARKVLGDLLDKYFGRYGQSSATIAVEQRFSFAFGPHQITGFVDRIDRLADGGLELIDYKTGQAMSQGDAESDLQLAIYDLAFYHDDDLRALGRPARVSYLYLKNIGPRADGKRSYAPTGESRGQLEERVRYYASAILAERFPSHRAMGEALPDLDPAERERAQHNDPCRFCAFTWVCPEMQREAGGD